MKLKKNKQVEKITNMVTGIVGLSVADSAAASMPAGLPRTITQQGTLPIAATSMLGKAADYGVTKKKRRRK